MTQFSQSQSDRALRRQLIAGLAQFQTPSLSLSLGQLITTMSLYLVLLTAMYVALQISIWITVALALPAAGMVVRLFIIQHDCGHRAYFRRRWGNDLVGWLCSIATFTPYANWRRQHAKHHTVWNNLDHRLSGADIYSSCLTVEEYLSLSTHRKCLYRMVQHPLILQFLVPPLIFLLLYRLPFDTPPHWRRERYSVAFTNVALAITLTILVVFLGWRAVLLVQLLVIVPASIAGVWLFSVQHRFEATVWMRQSDWTPFRASLEGSSYLKLIPILQWFTGNIGFHHIHHLLPRVPNYRLEACHGALQAQDQRIRVLTFGDALRAPCFVLWDESRHRMIPFP